MGHVRDPARRPPPDHVADGDYWVLSRYADVLAAARDTGRYLRPHRRPPGHHPRRPPAPRLHTRPAPLPGRRRRPPGARTALEELLARFPDFAVDAAGGTFAGGHYVRRYASLPFASGRG
ncbi:hypothetical protein GCM10010211_59970 [Streptomyces albospinus]|uniref:Uncharacterized protein n=1 Tax=Streptomyces albospinus TaxID=285515 RepID=A0ABQ2VGJ3_9ACTN|nr:hypothetical protein [Streptomyces albospinus]GGU85961.1 hypothetical protein GCM10010211_59970 [Streptomyces albospinus]